MLEETPAEAAEEVLDADAIKAAVQAMQQESGETIFEFTEDGDAEQTASEQTSGEAAFSIDVVDLYADDEQQMQEQIPPLLQADTETVDAGEIEAEMLAMEEAANGPPIEPPLPDTKKAPVQENTNAPAENTPAAEESSTESTEPQDSPVSPEETETAEETASAETNEAETTTTVTEEETPQKTGGWAARLKEGLSKSRDHMAKSLASVFGGGQIDEDLYEELETVLLTSDMGIEATEKLMDEVRRRVSLSGLKDGNELRQTLKEAVRDLLSPLEQPLTIPEGQGPFVIMMAGINGAGKTTSIGKLAKYFQAQGKSVLLAAGDTFRAAAREQLQEWGRRNGVTVISQESADSAAVCFDALEAAKARKIDIVLADTAGRLPTQLHLMEEIKKVKRVLQKAIPDAPHEVMVVLDANIGQNAVNQVAAFDEALGVTGLVVTKLDGTAKGGVLAALAERGIPVRFIGVGEKIDDLRPFDTEAFVEALFEDEQA
nr:signal recognition particle-docking protein FtsY [Conchiformibius steedae]